MPRRTGRPPTATDTFLWRICKALDEPPRVLAANLGVPYADLAPLLDHRHKLADLDRDEVWWKLQGYVTRRLGDMMAVQHELNVALQKDRSKRIVRTLRHAERSHRGSPRRG